MDLRKWALGRILPARVTQDAQSVGATAEVYNALRASGDPMADRLARDLADAENAYVGALFDLRRSNIREALLSLFAGEDMGANEARQAALAARARGSAWLSQSGRGQ